MSWASRIAREAKTGWLQSVNSRPVRFQLDHPVVSICFDDVPVSAVEVGVPLLDRHGIKATFYVALGMEAPGEFIGPADVRALHADGHEIGCHTYSHYRFGQGSVEGFASDAQRNRSALAAALNGPGPRSFSFPYGEMSVKLKGVLAPHYQTLRSSRPGVNVKQADFSCLRSLSLEASNFSAAMIDHWVAETARRRGWLIVYTHALTDTPGPYDLTPAMFDQLLATCTARGVRALPVEQAASLVSASRS